MSISRYFDKLTEKSATCRRSKAFIYAGLLLTNLSISFAYAGAWTLLPFRNENYIAAPSLSFTAGNTQINNVSSPCFGIELAFNSALLQAPDNVIRQHVGYYYAAKDKIALHSIELNPYYAKSIGQDFLLGAGPGIGILYLDAEDRSTNLLAAQLGVGVSYFGLDSFLLGMHTRYQMTTTRYYTHNNVLQDNANNWQFVFKAGYRF